MNPIESLIQGFQGLMAQVPEHLQPFIVALAATVPFLEGEIGAMLGVLGGLNPVVAGIAAAAGNFLSVFVVVVLGARIRSAIVARRAARRPVAVGARAPLEEGGAADAPKPPSKSQLKVRRYLERFGVPGASLLGPLAMPTQFTAALLVASGVARSWVLLWQAVAIVAWTTLTAVSSTLALQLVGRIG
jgi:hypothetical protein